MVLRRECLLTCLILLAPSAVSAICSGSTIGVGNLQTLANGTNRWSFFDNNCNTASFVDLTTNPCTSFFSCSAAPITFTGYTNQTDQSRYRYTCKPDGTAESCANNVAVSVCCVQGSVSISPTTSTTSTSAPASSSTSPSSSSTSSLGTSSSLSSSSLPSTTLISTNSQISSSHNSTSTSTSSSQIPAGTTSFQITSDPFPSSLASTTSSSLSNAGVSLFYTGSVSGAAVIGAAVIGAIYGSLAV